MFYYRVIHLLEINYNQVIANLIDIFDSIRIGLAIAIKKILKVKNSCCVCREFFTLIHIRHNKSRQIYFIYQKSLKRTLKTGF